MKTHHIAMASWWLQSNCFSPPPKLLWASTSLRLRSQPCSFWDGTRGQHYVSLRSVARPLAKSPETTRSFIYSSWSLFHSRFKKTEEHLDASHSLFFVMPSVPVQSLDNFGSHGGWDTKTEKHQPASPRPNQFLLLFPQIHWWLSFEHITSLDSEDHKRISSRITQNSGHIIVSISLLPLLDIIHKLALPFFGTKVAPTTEFLCSSIPCPFLSLPANGFDFDWPGKVQVITAKNHRCASLLHYPPGDFASSSLMPGMLAPITWAASKIPMWGGWKSQRGLHSTRDPPQIHWIPLALWIFKKRHGKHMKTLN